MVKKLKASDVLNQKLNAIHRGAYWFGIIGRLSIFVGVLSLLTSIFFLVTGAGADPQSSMYEHMISSLTGSLTPLISGWLFLLGRDAFEAIEALITEMNEIV